MTIDHDDELLDALGQGAPVPSGDPLAELFTAWRSEIDDSLPPLRLPAPEALPVVPPQRRSLSNSRWRRLGAAGSPAPDAAGDSGDPTATDGAGSRLSGAGSRLGDEGSDDGAGSRPGGPGLGDGPGSRGRGPEGSGPGRGRRWRVPRPAVIGAVAAAMLFGGLTAATASAEPGSPFWPITQIMFSDKASSKVAEQEAISLLTQARQALAENRQATAVELIAAAREKFALITDPAVRARLEAEAAALLAPLPALGSTVSPSPLPSNVEAPGVTPSPATPTPSPQKSGLLPPILPSLLPSLPLPSLPLPLSDLPLLG